MQMKNITVYLLLILYSDDDAINVAAYATRKEAVDELRVQFDSMRESDSCYNAHDADSFHNRDWTSARIINCDRSDISIEYRVVATTLDKTVPNDYADSFAF